MSAIDSRRVRRSQRDYTMTFKLSVIELVEKGSMTYKQAQQTYGIQGRTTVLTWLRKHGNLDWSKRVIMSVSKGEETPEQMIKRLQRELEDEKLKNLILNETINTVEKRYGIDVRKKNSPKQSKDLDNKEE